MATLDVKLVLSLIDRASGPARGVLARLNDGANGKAKRNLDGIGGSASAASGAMLALTRSMGGFAVGAGAYLGVKTALGSAMEFESAMADVQKKVSMAPDEFARLTKEIERIATKTPLAKTEVASLVAQAGQFGIANKDLTRFAELGARAAIAFEMDPTATADALSQVRNSLKLSIEELENFADATNTIADTTGASEEQLIDFTLRTAAGAKAAGLAGTDLLGLGSALVEVGVSAERAGTATNAMLAQMSALSKKRSTVRILDQIGGKGYSAKLQRKFFETPREALGDLFDIIAKLDKPRRAGLLMDMFGLQTQDEAVALANNFDSARRSFEKLSDTANYAGSVRKTYDLFASTTEQQLLQLGQNLEDAGSVLGAKVLPQINDAIKYLNAAFVEDEGRIDMFERIGLALDGLNQGFGGSSEAAKTYVADMERGFTELRDLIFGVAGEDPGNVQSMAIFERWKSWAEEVAASFQNAKNKFDVLKSAIVGEVNAEDIARQKREHPESFGPSKWDREVEELRRNSPPPVDDGLTDQQRSRIEGGWREPRKPEQGPPVPPRVGVDEATLFRILSGQSKPMQAPAVPLDPEIVLQRALGSAAGLGAAQSTGPQAVSVAGPVMTTPSGVQSVRVENQQPILAPINVTVNVSQSQASPEAIAAATGGAIRAALHSVGDMMVE
jgi:TP901 family phage tail tape measure protein